MERENWFLFFILELDLFSILGCMLGILAISTRQILSGFGGLVNWILGRETWCLCSLLMKIFRAMWELPAMMNVFGFTPCMYITLTKSISFGHG